MKTINQFLAAIFIAFLAAAAFGGEAQRLMVGWGRDPFAGCPSASVLKVGSNVMVLREKDAADAVSIFAGSSVLAVRRDGTVYAWGNNAHGAAIGAFNGLNSASGIVKIDGKILSNVVALAGGHGQSLAVRQDGTVVSWGFDGNQMLALPPGLSNVAAVSTGGWHDLALRKNGQIVAWGDKDIIGDLPSRMTNVLAVAIAASAYRDYAITRGGQVAEWFVSGAQPSTSKVFLTNDDGSTDFGYKQENFTLIEGLSNVVAIAAGSTHMLALKADGTVYGQGSGGGTEIIGVGSTNHFTSGMVTIGGKLLTDAVAIAVGQGSGLSSYSLALKRDGTVVEWGTSPYHQYDPPPGLSNVVAIAAGNQFCLAIATNIDISKLPTSQQPPK